VKPLIIEIWLKGLEIALSVVKSLDYPSASISIQINVIVYQNYAKALKHLWDFDDELLNNF
jgi:hypothetical protein